MDKLTRLRKQQELIVAEARAKLNEINENTTEARAAEIEAEYDAAMAEYDRLQGEIDAETGNETRSGDSRRPRGEDTTVGGFDAEPVSALLRPEQRFTSGIQAPPQELRGLTVGRLLRSMVTGPVTEQERRALAEGTDSAGGYTVPTILSAQLIDLLRARTVAIQAGAMSVPLTSARHHIAKLASDPIPAWRAENAIVNESDPTFSRVILEPKSLAVLVKVSRELLEDSLNLETALPNVLAAALARELDRVVFLGTGTAAEPAGLDTIAGVQSFAFNDVPDDFTAMLVARKMLMSQNVEQVSAYVVHPDTEATIGSFVADDGQPLAMPSILDRPTPARILTTTQIPVTLGAGSNETTMYAGDFRQLVIGIRSDIRVEVLRERYADTLQYGFLAFLRADVAAVHPQAFVRITGLQLP